MTSTVRSADRPSRGRGGFDEMSLCSIAQAMLLYAPGPVAVVREAA